MTAPLAPLALLDRWLRRALAPDRMGWLDGQRERVRGGALRDLHMGVGAIGARLGRGGLALSEDDLAEAGRTRPGWRPDLLDMPAAARILVMLEFAQAPADFADGLRQLCATADEAEAVALYRGLPLYPDPAALDWQVGEGLRTSMAPIFAAIAHWSPFPAERFGEERWNHMVLKALFLDLPLAPIGGFDARRNPALAEMARRYADERRAAGRPIAPELWRCVAPFATRQDVVHLLALAASPEPARRAAAALALAESSPADLDRLPEERAAIHAGALTWTTLPQGTR